MLGPSAVLLGIPLAIGAAVGAVRTAPDRVFAVAALVVSVLEALGIAVLLGMVVVGG